MNPVSLKDRCTKVQERFLELLDGQIASYEREELEAHLGACQECARHWREYGMVVESLRSLNELKVPPTVLEGIRKRVKSKGLIRRLRRWMSASPWAFPRPAVAALGILMIALGVWQLGPWRISNIHEPPEFSLRTDKVEPPNVNIGASWTPWEVPGRLVGLAPGLDLEPDWPITGRTLIQDDMILEITATEEVFKRIEAILSESKGRMFLVGLRHLNSGEILRSRILLEVPLATYERVANQIEALGPVKRVLMERDSLPPRPDRLRITLVATDALDHLRSSELERVKAD